MRVYSESIETFLEKVNVFAKEILTREFGVRVARTRFHLNNVSSVNFPALGG